MGAGLVNLGTANLIDSTISGNSAATKSSGVLSTGTLSMTNCTVSGNYGRIDAGITNVGGGATLTNVTISGNQAGGGSSAVINGPGSTMTMTNCTVSGNKTDFAGAAVYNSGTFSMTNSIVAGNSPSDVSGINPSGNNLISVDPLLAPLGNYGGPTQTMALLPGSPAIGAGTSGAGMPITDQRGEARAGHTDIGAFRAWDSCSPPPP